MSLFLVNDMEVQDIEVPGSQFLHFLIRAEGEESRGIMPVVRSLAFERIALASSMRSRASWFTRAWEAGAGALSEP